MLNEKTQECVRHLLRILLRSVNQRCVLFPDLVDVATGFEEAQNEIFLAEFRGMRHARRQNVRSSVQQDAGALEMTAFENNRQSR